ncbi:CAF1-domain-containing protein [Hypoxylon trugodes]|uniref:CAF1-domain-containing protein n=1 Tax=Hypoxylon trugodes TaxID=326681 RepID=UPI00219F86CA|nr:CAF1-domain-containing protein [Hypoxylon trugodes]KAI1384634.1 CAF1-domain-containing protein [Hypoxylon trugodes]
MEVDRRNFFWLLPTMLSEAQKARFVAIDIEMSGIAFTQDRGGVRRSFQDSYTKIKEAAEEFQLLQIGFTFFHCDEKLSGYRTRTFNCHVSPLFPIAYFPNYLTRQLDRKFSVSARSYSFLRQHNFDFSHALDNGVYYLNREEQRAAKNICISTTNKQHIDPLTLDENYQNFYKHTRAAIEKFINLHPQPSGTPTIIKNPNGGDLTKLQTRLIHQLVRDEYPLCSAEVVNTGSLTGCVSINLIERAEKPEWELENLEAAQKLSGLQILLEALAGGSFAERVNRKWVYHDNPGTGPIKELNKQFDFYQCEASLKESRPILIGHNIFQDLAFIYQTFFEPLPPGFGDFLTKVHGLFPRIADTKFMYQSNNHITIRNQSLEGLHNYYAKIQHPIIVSWREPGSSGAAAHNAGFDSEMTAILFLKQTRALLTAEGRMNNAPNGQIAKSEGEKKVISLLDVEEPEMLEALRGWNALFEDETDSKEPVVTEKKVPAHKGDLSMVPRERHPSGDLNIIPAWTDPFWRTYGNRTSIAGVGHVTFTRPLLYGGCVED